MPLDVLSLDPDHYGKADEQKCHNQKRDPYPPQSFSVMRPPEEQPSGTGH